VKGTVLGFDPETHAGAISGHDGQRYDFVALEWHAARRPTRGDLVDFVPDGARAVHIYIVEEEYVPPTLTEFLFSFRGRISRSQYWLRWLLPVFAISIVLTMCILAAAHANAWAVGAALGVVYVIFSLATIWPTLAIAAKRAHDRDWPGPFILLLFVPLVQFWPMIELWFLRGTIGSNRFGPDPVR
jgi:uncharacterized membrane protein YhaH (DUF805 family)